MSHTFEHIASDTEALAELVVQIITDLGRSVGTNGLVWGSGVRFLCNWGLLKT
jgi:hypothetical protein